MGADRKLPHVCPPSFYRGTRWHHQ